MRALWDEVAPAAPLLIPLGEVLLWALAFAFCIAVVYVAKAFFGVTGTLLGKLPVVGGWINSTAHHIEQRIANVFGAAAATCDAKMGAALHSLARFVDKLGAEITRHAHLLLALAQLLPGAGTLVQTFGAVARLWHALHALERRIVGIGHDIPARLHGIERGIGADVLPRIRHLEREVTRTIEHDIASLRARDKALTREYERLYKWMRSHPWTAVTGAFVGAVAIALARLGLDWIRCPTAKSVFKKRGCNLWRDLDRLLGLVGEVALVTNICQVIPWLEEGFSVVAAPLVSTLTGIGAGLCGANSAPPELLPVTTLYVPSGPDATLYLP